MVYLLQQLLMEAAQKYPNKDAVVYEDESISYKDLDEVTNKLAVRLLENGVKRGDRVGIYTNKSISSIISIHGILKAGAIYVPLDPNAPLARSAYIVQNCNIKTLLASTKKADTINEMLSEQNPLDLVVLMDNRKSPQEKLAAKTISWDDVVGRKPVPPPTNPSIETDLAYILYTSGSTGVPKGVMISHINALTFVRWACDTIKVSSEDTLSSHAPLHFDLSIFDIFAAFKGGATLALVPEGLSTFPLRLAAWIENHHISVWYSVPSVLSMMVLHGEMNSYKFSKLRTIIFAGEVFPTKYLRDLMTLIPHVEYYNFYGPTETNVITYYKVPTLDPEQTKPIPIGEPCANSEVFAITEDNKIVANPEEIGELFARGSCVAQGYWADVEKTKRTFVSNHTQSTFEERLYRTGDLVTLDEEGNYIFLGRRDHMIKSRGYRIELGEIEQVLYNHPEVKEAAVVAIPDELIGNRIKAFISLNNKNGISPTELQDFCLKSIPRYMVPEMIEFRESLPKTSTGKINKPVLVSPK